MGYYHFCFIILVISTFLFISNDISYSIYDGGTFSVHYPVNWSYAVDGSTFRFSDESGASIILHIIDVSSYGSITELVFETNMQVKSLDSEVIIGLTGDSYLGPESAKQFDASHNLFKSRYVNAGMVIIITSCTFTCIFFNNWHITAF